MTPIIVRDKVKLAQLYDDGRMIFVLEHNDFNINFVSKALWIYGKIKLVKTKILKDLTNK